MVAGIALDQALHGYADGHQLLASSLDLTKDQQALLLVMSDLSGPAFRSGFESYLTGYPLQGAGHYCFARTWFAPELSRPGCVWTHTLIIRNEDLARIGSFRALDQTFRRPQSLQNLSGYETPTLYRNLPPTPFAQLTDSRLVLEGVYASDRKIVVPSESSSTYEALVLAIFDQQWPRLRRGFRFCTGALSLREAGFDLSVSPPEVTHSVGESGLVLTDRRPLIRGTEEWLELADRDLGVSTSQSTYRQFLWNFGPDYADGRTAFRPLTELFALLETEDGSVLGDKTLAAVAHFFPKPHEARRLKSELFGRQGRYYSKMGGDESVTRLLVTHPAAFTLESDIAAIKQRSIELAAKDTDAATDLATLAVQIGGENAQLFLEGYFEQERWSDETLRRVPSALVLDIVDRYPTLVASPSLWKRLDRMGVVNKTIARLNTRSDLLNGAIKAIVDSNAWDALATVVEQVGSAALLQVFGIIESSQTATIDCPDKLYAIFSSQPALLTGLIEAKQLGPRSLRLLTAELDPRSWHWRRLGLAPWIEAVKLDIPFSTGDRSRRSAVFFLSVGLLSRDDGAALLVAGSFSVVYEAAKIDALASSLWDELEPSLSWYTPSWDRCARLIKTITSAFKERSWPLRCFPETFKTVEEFSRALTELDKAGSGRRYIRRLKEAGLAGELTWSVEQSTVLENFV